MNNPLLSICIPTLNRAAYLSGLLENIKNELDDSINNLVEIVIVDGFSTDHTKNVIDIYSNYLNIRSYYRNQKKGIDKDILKSVELSLGKYCWLFSDDDRFFKNSIHYVIAKLNNKDTFTGIFCNRVPFDKEMQTKVSDVSKWPCSQYANEEYLTTKSECFMRIGMDFGYISSQIISREAWNEVLTKYDTTKLNGSMYQMVDIIANMMVSKFRWMIINRPLVKQRTGNDSLLARKGIVHRQKIEHIGFQSILKLHYKTHDPEYRVFIHKMIGRLPRVIANIKSQKIDYHKQILIYKMHIRKYYRCPAFWIKTLPIMLVPNSIFTVIKKIYFKYWIQ